jgi:hypothetical protein
MYRSAQLSGFINKAICIIKYIFSRKPEEPFRIGWEWVKVAFVKGWELIFSISFTDHHDPDAAMASHKQDEKRRYRIELQFTSISVRLSSCSKSTSTKASKLLSLSFVSQPAKPPG